MSRSPETSRWNKRPLNKPPCWRRPAILTKKRPRKKADQRCRSVMASPMVPASSNEERGTLVLLVQGEAGRDAGRDHELAAGRRGPHDRACPPRPSRPDRGRALPRAARASVAQKQPLLRSGDSSQILAGG